MTWNHESQPDRLLLSALPFHDTKRIHPVLVRATCIVRENTKMLNPWVSPLTMSEFLYIITCLIKHMHMQLIPGTSLFHRPKKKVGLGTRL